MYSSFCFLQLTVLSRSPCPPPAPAYIARSYIFRIYRTYCRSERDINKHTAQCRAISSAQAPFGIIINSLFAPINHGPLLSAPFIYMCQSLNSCIPPCASVAGGASSLAERSPVLSLNHTEYHQVLDEVPGTRYGWYVCVLVFLLFRRWFCSPSRSSSRFFLRNLHPPALLPIRTWHHQHTAQHRQ